MISVLMLSTALADPTGIRAAQRAASAMDRTGPHVARYAQEIDGEPAEIVLEVYYYGVGDVEMNVMSGSTGATFAVDAEHARIRVQDQCAVVLMEPILRTVDDVHTTTAQQLDRLAAQLDYRLTPDGRADMNIVFQRTDLPASLGWISDMALEQATVQKDGRRWAVEMDGVRWWVTRKTGILERMTVDDQDGGAAHTLTRVSVEPIAPDASREETRCPQSSDDLTTAMFTAQLLWSAYGRSLGDAIPTWSRMDPLAQEEAIQKQRAFWRHYLAVETLTWEAGFRNDPIWRASLVAGISDVSAFHAFAARLPEDQQADPMRAWQERWFTSIGQTILQDLISNTEQKVYQEIAAAGIQLDDPGVISSFVLEPMSQEAILAGEEVLSPLLREVVQQGGTQLGVQLTRP